MRQRPGCRCGGRDGHTHGQPEARKSCSHVCGQALLAAEQMRDSGDVEPEPIGPIHLYQRRPALRPAREPLHQRRIAGWVGGNGDEAGVERTCVGQSRARPRTALGGNLGDRMDDRPVRALDGEDDRRPATSLRTGASTSLRTGVRRRVAALRPPLDRQMRQPDGKHPCHARGSSGPAACLSRGTARRPMPAFRAPADRVG